MKATMKKSIACLLAVLLVIQMVPAFADQIITSYTPGNVIFRDKLEITSEAGKGTIMTVGMTNQLSVNDGYSKLVWSSDNESVATVDQNGLVTAVGPGKVKITITAEDGHYSDSIIFKVTGVPTPENNDGEEEQLVIIVSGDKTKVEYNGQVQTNTYSVTSNKPYDTDKLVVNQEGLASGTDCRTYKDKLSATYDGDAEIIISDGWLQIKPATVKVKANDAVQTGDEKPEFTATVTGLVEGEDPETIQYTLDVYVAGDVTYITPVCESIQGNYRVITEPGILVIENGVYRAIKLTSDWPAGQPAYAGTMITMTAELIGFENVDYTLQWQYSVDNKEWINEPGANGTSFTFELNETTVQYTWRVVASY
jgi:hypothetical protein